MSLFQGIEQLRGQLETVVESITFLPDGRLGVIVSPRVAADELTKSPHLGHEFSLKATAAELDAGFAAEFMPEVAGVYASVAEQAREQAARAKATAAAKPVSKGLAKSGKAGKPDVDFDDDESADSDAKGTTATAGLSGAPAVSSPPAAASAAPVVMTAGDLFAMEG